FAPSGQVNFYTSNDPNSTPISRTIIGSAWLQATVSGDTGDVWIGELNAPVPSNVATYPILNLPFGSDFGGLGISTFGLSATTGDGTDTSVRLGRNVINAGTAGLYSFNPPVTNVSQAYVYQFSYNTPGVGPDESQVIVGDSGGPSFFLY